MTSAKLQAVDANAISLGGQWRASELAARHRRAFAMENFNADHWTTVAVPGHWSGAPGLDTTKGPVLLRHEFSAEPLGRRSWLTFHGVWNRAIVWFDGAYIGEVEGYFTPKSFDVSAYLATTSSHVLAVEVERHPSPWDAGNNSGGLWAAVSLEQSGPVRISRCKVVCTEAGPDRSVLSISAELDALDVEQARIKTVINRLDGATVSSTGFTRAVANGSNRVQWSVIVEDGPLWWPWTHGDAALVDVEIEVSCAGEVSDRHTLRSGFRHVTRNNGYLFVNGERIYLRGLGSTKPLTPLEPDYQDNAVSQMKTSGLNVIEVGPWIERSSLYRSADAEGMLVLQTMPWAPGTPRTTGRLRRQCVETLGHHPSVAAWIEPAPLTTLLTRLGRRPEENSAIDSSRPTLDTIEPWSFDESGDEFVAGLVGRWSRRARLVKFRSSKNGIVPIVDQLRRHKYQPLGGFIAEDLDVDEVDNALRPVTAFIHNSTDPQPGRVWHGEVTVVNDTNETLDDVVVKVAIDTGSSTHNWSWEGNAGPDSVTVVGRFRLVLPLATMAIHGLITLCGAGVEQQRSIAIALAKGTE